MLRWRGRIGLGVAVAVLGCALAAAAVRGDHVLYVGGTLPLPEHTMGRLDLAGPAAEFLAAKGGAAFTIPYQGVESLEYGEKVGRRLGAALAVSPLFLLSHKRRHFVTLTFKDARGATQGAVLEIGKHDVHTVLAAFSERSHVTVVYQSAEARADAAK